MQTRDECWLLCERVSILVAFPAMMTTLTVLSQAGGVLYVSPVNEGQAGVSPCGAKGDGIQNGLLAGEDALHVVGSDGNGGHDHQVGLYGSRHLPPVLQQLFHHLPGYADLAAMRTRVAETCGPVTAKQ